MVNQTMTHQVTQRKWRIQRWKEEVVKLDWRERIIITIMWRRARVKCHHFLRIKRAICRIYLRRICLLGPVRADSVQQMRMSGTSFSMERIKQLLLIGYCKYQRRERWAKYQMEHRLTPSQITRCWRKLKKKWEKHLLTNSSRTGKYS